MAQTLSLSGSCATSAAFRVWGSAISAALATNGQVQTADTGQINWTTVAAAGTGTAAGYEIWRFNDSIQSTAPVYFKIEYGTGTNTSTPQMWITVGTGSDGAGTITGTNITGVFGAVTTRRTVGPTTTGAAGTTGNVYVNGDSGCLAILAWPALTSIYGGMALLIERQRAWDGTTVGDGVLTLTTQNASSGSVTLNLTSFVPNLAANTATTNNSGILGPSGSATQGPLSCVYNATLYPAPLYTSAGLVRPGAPSQYIMGMCSGDFAANATFTMNHYGVSRTWLSAGLGCGGITPPWGTWGNGNLGSFIFRIS